MSKSLLLMICILTGLLVLACAKTADTNRNANAVATSNAASPASATNANHTASAADKIGIEECDSFLTAYDHCVSTNVPEASRAQYKQSLAAWRSTWKKAADNPATRGTLAGICKNALEQSRLTMKSFNCTF